MKRLKFLGFLGLISLACLFVSCVVEEDAANPSLPRAAMPLPIVEQATDFSCGPAAILSVLRYWLDVDVTEQDLYALMGTTVENGTTPQGLVRGARYFGLKAEMRENLTIQDLEEPLRSGATIILDIQAWVGEKDPDKVDWENRWDDGHYVVLIAKDDHFAYFMDPSIDNEQYGFISLEELPRRWHDWEIENGQRREYRQVGVIIRGDEPQDLKLRSRKLTRIL